MATLNGWQRLWVVVTVFWTVAVLSFTSTGRWPSPSASLRELEAWSESPLLTLAEGIRAKYSDHSADMQEEFDWPDILKAIDEGRLTSKRVMDQLETPEERGAFINQLNDPQLEEMMLRMLDSERQALRDGRVEYVRKTLMVWAIPPVFLYAFGWSAGWIRRGFRQ